MKRPLDLWFTEQVEFLAFILGLTLVLKLFVFEAFEVPTGSMQPTILGDAEAGIRDRILADKLVTLLRPPRRWEVYIFRLPYDERELYVKRVVGLPGERLEILGGDLWIDGAIARKPDAVNDSVLKQVYPVGVDGVDLTRAFRPSGAGVELDGPRAVFSAGERGLLRSRRVIRDEYLHGYDPAWGIRPKPMARYAVADLALDLDVELGPDGDFVEIALEADDGTLTCRLPSREGESDVLVEYRPSGVGANPTTYLSGRILLLDPGVPVPVSLRWIDRRITLRVGDESFSADQDDLPPRSDMPRRASIALSMPGGGVVSAVNVRRDIFYPPRGPTRRWQIPDEQYFFMGDNTQASHDSRQWEVRTLTLPDGEVEGFWLPWLKPGPSRRGANPTLTVDGHYAFADTHGNVSVFDPDDILDQRSDMAPFVHSRYLLGKVLAVYWPVVAPFRWKLVR